MDDRQLIARVEDRLAELESLGDPAARELALQAVGAVVELYGEGLARMVQGVGEGATRELAGDELIAHLLLLHGLHPVSVEDRVRAALDGVRPYLGSHGGDVQLLGVAGGVARVRMQGACDGCPASAMTLRQAIEDAVLKAAPDVDGVEAEGADVAPASSPLLQIEIPCPAPRAADAA